MNPLLSICIPSLNRPELLLHALKSIRAPAAAIAKIEICISNNCSDMDYGKVDEFLRTFVGPANVTYVRHDARLTLDENMHSVKKMASGRFVYFLGDDDYFLEDQIELLVQFTEANDPHLAIFNGNLVDAHGCYLGPHFSFPPKDYLTVESAFKDLRDRGMFGAVLVRRDLLNDDDFLRLYGTSHAYGCFWLALMRLVEENVKIFIPNFPCVALRCAEKNYNHVYVYYRDIPYEFAVYKRFADPRALPLIAQFERLQEKKISSFRFFCALSDMGCDLSTIKLVNRSFYDKHRLFITIGQYIGSSFIYKFSRQMYCSFVARTHIEKQTTAVGCP